VSFGWDLGDFIVVACLFFEVGMIIIDGMSVQDLIGDYQRMGIMSAIFIRQTLG